MQGEKSKGVSDEESSGRREAERENERREMTGSLYVLCYFLHVSVSLPLALAGLLPLVALGPGTAGTGFWMRVGFPQIVVAFPGFALQVHVQTCRHMDGVE